MIEFHCVTSLLQLRLGVSSVGFAFGGVTGGARPLHPTPPQYIEASITSHLRILRSFGHVYTIRQTISATGRIISCGCLSLLLLRAGAVPLTSISPVTPHLLISPPVDHFDDLAADFIF